MKKQHIVAAMLVIAADSVAQADEIAAHVAEQHNDSPLRGLAAIYLDESIQTVQLSGGVPNTLLDAIPSGSAQQPAGAGRLSVVRDVPGAEIGHRAIIDEQGFTVCNPSPMGEARAVLFAAAPELVEALRAVVLDLRQLHNYHYPKCEGGCPADAALLQAEAVLAKIDGAVQS